MFDGIQADTTNAQFYEVLPFWYPFWGYETHMLKGEAEHAIVVQLRENDPPRLLSLCFGTRRTIAQRAFKEFSLTTHRPTKHLKKGDSDAQ
jgi:hypothetical protein